MDEIRATTETKLVVGKSVKEEKINQADDVVLYDECGDTLWDRVLRQEENKLKLSADPEA